MGSGPQTEDMDWSFTSPHRFLDVSIDVISSLFGKSAGEFPCVSERLVTCGKPVLL
jgi:hypothetical protein